MNKIIWYNHTFSNTNIRPAFVDIEAVGSTLYYAYYFILYPTGLAIVLAVPNELASVSYSPYTNYFTTADSLSGGMVKLVSVTPKIYQFVGASQILVSAGAWSPLHSETSSNVHYKWYGLTASNNPIRLNTSTKRIIWQGTEYGTLPEMLFIDPALWMWQTLSTDSIDTNRYPLYKKNNLYYKSTSIKETNAQYLSVAADAFSHDGPMWSYVNQDWTRGYASKNKLGILLNSEVRNPVAPSNKDYFSAATVNNNTKDIYQWDDERYMTEKYGIKDGANSYQLSFSPVSSITGAEGFQLNHSISPDTSRSRTNPWILWDTNSMAGLSLQDVYYIDQFILSANQVQFKIPLNWTVRYYSRKASIPNFNIDGYWPVTVNGQWTASYLPTCTYIYNPGTSTVEITHTYTNREYILLRDNSYTSISPNWTTRDIDHSSTKIQVELNRSISQIELITGQFIPQITDIIPSSWNFQINYIIKDVPIIPGCSDIDTITDEPLTDRYTSTGKTCLWTDADCHQTVGNWSFINYLQQKGGALGSNRVLGGICHKLVTPNGICAPFTQSMVENASSTATIDVFVDNKTIPISCDKVDKYDNDQAGFTGQFYSENNDTVIVLVAYPEE